MADTLGTHNPLRYRGYVYDAETGLYYLQSRYYDPGMGRFINADKYVTTGQGILGGNMFSYCNSNPVIRTDSTGDIYRAYKNDFAGYGGGIVIVPIFDWLIHGYEDIKDSLTESISFAKKKAKNKSKGENQPKAPDVKYPGNDPGKSPGDDFEWRGKLPKGSDKGAWVNKKTGEQWHPDLNHPPKKGPHWDYTDSSGYVWSVFEDGRVIIW